MTRVMHITSNTLRNADGDKKGIGDTVSQAHHKIVQQIDAQTTLGGIYSWSRARIV